MSIDIFGIVRDALVIGYMFVLRIGVPVLITLMIGAWLKRLLEEHEEKPESAEIKLKAGQRCWDVRSNPDTAEARALSSKRPDLPCWLAIQVDGASLKEMCYACPEYTSSPSVAVKA